MKRFGPGLFLFLIGAAAFGFDLSVGAKWAAGGSTNLGEDYADALKLASADRGLLFSFSGGIFATLGLAEKLAIEPEVLILRLGGVQKYPTSTEYDMCNYLAPAVLIKIRLGTANLFTGPAFFFKQGSGSQRIKTDGGTETESDFSEDYLADVLFAVAGGAGLQFRLGPGSLVAELRTYYSFTSVLNQDTSSGRWYPFTAMAVVGYSLPIRK